MPSLAQPAPGARDPRSAFRSLVFHRRAHVVRSVAAAVIILGIAGSACAPARDAAAVPGITAAEHRRVIEAWRQERISELQQPDGWLSLAGLLWLDEGDNSFGSDPSNKLVYEESGTPPRLGTFVVEGETVRFDAAPGVEIGVVDGQPRVISLVVRQAPPAPEGNAPESAGPPTPAPVPVLTWGSLRWHIMRREGRFVVRLKDARSPVLLGFEGIEMFPVDRAWRFDALFEPYDPPKEIMIPNVLGSIGESRSPGAVVFEVGGETYRLDMWKDSDDPENFFTAFGDLTNRVTTYGGGRFLWVDAPDESGRTVVDFNRAYNPPCAFTPFATCPLPPEQNRLPLAIEAGEKAYKSPVVSH